MDILLKGYTALKGERGQAQNPEETIEKLCDQVNNCTLLEDRRAAVLGLKGLAKDWKLLVGTKSLSVLLKTLKQDKQDVEIIKAALEALNILCTTNDKTKQDDLGSMFTEIFTKDPLNISLLLEVLQDPDFYVRFETIQLFNTLLDNSNSLQDGILASPMGISRLVDLLNDNREIIRNDGLLLLIALTKSNAEIQKIVAFENVFEKLMGIIIEEGAADGGIIVEDCVKLIHNLLRHNISNQNLFRETSCIHKIPGLFGTVTDDPNLWIPQKINNTIAILELIRILVNSKNPNATANQNILNSAKVLSHLISLSFEVKLPETVRTQIFFALGETIRGNSKNQDIFGKNIVQSDWDNGVKIPAILYIIMLALKHEDLSLRASAVYTFECFVYKNTDFQLGLSATLLPPPETNPNDNSNESDSAGSLLVSSMLDWESSRKDPYTCWFGSVMLSHFILNNHQAKLVVLKKNTDNEEENISLLHKCVFALLNAQRQSADVRITLGIFCFLAIWLDDCPEAVSEFLGEGSNIQFIVELVAQSSGIHSLVQGLASFILGLCFEYNNDSEASFTKANIQSIIINRIGLDVFTSRLDRIQESKEFNSATSTFWTSEKLVKPLPDIYFDYAFVELFKSGQDSIIKSVSNTTTFNDIRKGARAISNSPENNIELLSLKKSIKELEIALVSQKEKYSNLQDKYEEAIKESAAMKIDYEDLLVFLAEQDIECKMYRSKLRDYGEVIVSDDEEEEYDDDDE